MIAAQPDFYFLAVFIVRECKAPAASVPELKLASELLGERYT